MKTQYRVTFYYTSGKFAGQIKEVIMNEIWWPIGSLIFSPAHSESFRVLIIETI